MTSHYTKTEHTLHLCLQWQLIQNRADSAWLPYLLGMLSSLSDQRDQ